MQRNPLKPKVTYLWLPKLIGYLSKGITRPIIPTVTYLFVIYVVIQLSGNILRLLCKENFLVPSRSCCDGITLLTDPPTQTCIRKELMMNVGYWLQSNRLCFYCTCLWNHFHLKWSSQCAYRCYCLLSERICILFQSTIEFTNAIKTSLMTLIAPKSHMVWKTKIFPTFFSFSNIRVFPPWF